MKVAYTDVSDTQKSLQVEIEPDVVGTEIDRVIRGYARSLKLPGFRPGRFRPRLSGSVSRPRSSTTWRTT